MKEGCTTNMRMYSVWKVITNIGYLYILPSSLLDGVESKVGGDEEVGHRTCAKVKYQFR